MRLRSVTVKNFRMHGELSVAFDGSRTLVAGPNESGKSTLMEAIERVLFYPHRSEKGLEEIKPRVGGGPPEVILRFERNGHACTLRKVFKGAQATAELKDETAGRKYSGDEAETELRSLLALGEGPLRQPLHGWSHLWVSQGEAAENPTGKESLDKPQFDRLGARLQSLTGTALMESAADGATYRRIIEEHDRNYTSKGIKTGSPLGTAAAELAAAREAAMVAAGNLAEYEDAADTVIREEDAIRSHRREQADAEQNLAATMTTLDRIQQLETTLERERRESTEAAAAYARLRDADAEIGQLAQSIAALNRRFAAEQEAINQLRIHEQRMQSEVAHASRVTSGAFESMQACAARRDLLTTIEKLFALQAERADLEKRQAEIDELSEQTAEIAGQLREIPEVDRPTIASIEDLDRRRQLGTAKLEAIATRLEVLRVDAAVRVDEDRLAAGEQRTLTDAADLCIGDGTTIRITPGGGQSLSDLRVEIADLQAQLGVSLARLGVASVQAAREHHERRLALQAEGARLEEKINGLGGAAMATRLIALHADLEKAEAEVVRKTPAGFVRPADAATLEVAIQSAEGAHGEVELAVRQAKEAYDIAVAAADAARVNREDAERQVMEQTTALRELEIAKAALERDFGTDRAAELQRLAGLASQAEHAVEQTVRAIASLSPELARGDRDRFERTVDQSKNQIVAAEIRMAGAKAILGRTGSIDLPGAKAAEEARLAVATRRHAEILRRAEAAKLLRDLFDARRQEMAELVATPLRKKVAEYLDALYGPGCRLSIKRTGDAFAELEVSRPVDGGVDFEFESLSGGTREQVAAACRLAMAELLAGGEEGGTNATDRCLPMVFDDAFVNSDPDRIRSIHRLLDLGASRGLQIVVLSCNPGEYAQFGALRFDMPKPRRDGPPPLPADRSAASDGDGTSGADAAEPSVDVTAGRVPEGSDETLEDRLRSVLRDMVDRKAGNGALRAALGWDEGTYERIRERLVAAGRIEKGKGRGGSVRLTDDD